MLNKNKPFYLDDTPTMPGKFVMRLNHDKCYCSGTEGSYGVLPARLLHMSYPDFLRLCRDVCGAELVGKNCKYVVPYFKMNAETNALIDLLNGLMDLLKALKENPDWEMKKRFVDEYYNSQAKFVGLTKEDIEARIEK